MEKDDELKGEGNSYDFGARIYDPRIGRWMSRDPQFGIQPGWSPYKAFLDNPIVYIDPEGETEYQINIYIDERSGETMVEVTTANSIMTDGVSHMVSSWYDFGGYHNESFFYDYATITVTTIDKDGNTSVDKTVEVLYENGLKDWEFGGSNSHSKKESFSDGPDHGIERSFGIAMTGKKGASGASGQDFSKNAVGFADWDDIKGILKVANGLDRIHRLIGKDSWQGMSSKSAKDWITATNKGLKEGDKIGDIWEQIVAGEADESSGSSSKLKNQNQENKFVCPTCGGSFSSKDTTNHNNGLNRKSGPFKEKK